MGNCSLKAESRETRNPIRVLTDSGCVVQFKGPKQVHQVLEAYKGYEVFKQGHASSPLAKNEWLTGKNMYYLLRRVVNTEEKPEEIRKKSLGRTTSDVVENLANGSALEVLPSEGNGVWRVKLVIDTKQLEEILSEQVNTEALIEKMRMAATASPMATTTRRLKRGCGGADCKPTVSSTMCKLLPMSKAQTKEQMWG